MKFNFILLLLVISSNVTGPSSYHYQNKIVKIDSNFVQVWAYCKGYCKNIEPHLVAEGYVFGKVKKTFEYINTHREGIWKFYDNNGTLVNTAEFYKNFKLGDYEYADTKGGIVKCNIKKVGESKIEYFDEKGKKTQENSFILSEEKIKIVKSFFNKKGEIESIEVWLEGVRIE